MWTKSHAEYLECQIKRLNQEEADTSNPVAREVFHACKIALINLRHPIDDAAVQS